MQTMNSDEFIPHRGRMKLIGPILELNHEQATVAAVVAESWPLCSGSSVSPIVLIEVVAQAAGVLSSYRKGASRSLYKGGWLTGIKIADFCVDTVPLGAELVTTVTCRYSLEDYEALAGTVMHGEQCLCTVELQVVGLKADAEEE